MSATFVAVYKTPATVLLRRIRTADRATAWLTARRAPAEWQLVDVRREGTAEDLPAMPVADSPG